MIKQTQKRTNDGGNGYKKIHLVMMIFIFCGLFLNPALSSETGGQERREQDHDNTLSLLEARHKVTALHKEMQDIQSRLSIEQNIAMSKFALDNHSLKEKIDTPPAPRDEFETTAEYEARLQKHLRQIEPLKNKYETDYNNLLQKYEKELDNNEKKYNAEITALLNSPYPAEGLNPVLVRYNADKEIYKLKIIEPDGRFWEYELAITPRVARELTRRKNILEVEGFYTNIDALFLTDVTLIDPILGKLNLNTAVLRSGCTVLDFTDIMNMLHLENFFDKVENKTGNFANIFELTVLRSNPVVLDRSLGLMWHWSGSDRNLGFEEAEQWVKDLNKAGYAGYRDWRLPTAEEAASLLEKKQQNGLYIDPIFSSRQANIWTCDKSGTGRIWVASFFLGSIADYREPVNGIYARPVRSGKAKDGLVTLGTFLWEQNLPDTQTLIDYFASFSDYPDCPLIMFPLIISPDH